MSATQKTLEEKANSPDEMLDLVDENDVVIGIVARPEANTNPELIHREISVLLFDAEKNIVIQKRSKYKSVHPNMWSMLAGHIPAGADPEETAYRELEEEFGLTKMPLTFLTKKHLTYPHESHFMYYFVAKYSGEKITFDESEVSEIKIVSQKELHHMIESGESFNTKYLPLLEEIWAGVYTI
ncbi:MAG: hypothetical protein CO156_03305 [Candidatus Pacebacteria bacterium CG_4_9_14_3_um_filter_40_12]|nr:NUDIX domain-containing protein [Candidatus Paceibacterota bacterium]PIR64167.1 MAG: hypothetical protein COU64_00425 [Candidatus Pacebacteria bacterium CG10_big_fil_rev_8_21_14_0_10_40_26]PIZ79309.1 MAG: hypothetical protein COY01_02695 [Candidatus Pacebacteria bacterium CG_4_10_14_0_2_um_filter_40_20]PJA68965.1 MAG: hypothetical protein CO156_03305 [Candidatus Pacebacteria bacterium CG_4_9_14_3_um_filter_40_12]PJC42276.1 MAG: hypothetical protein CO041_01405 [Candidatus Pacebacteria bacter